MYCPIRIILTERVIRRVKLNAFIWKIYYATIM